MVQLTTAIPAIFLMSISTPVAPVQGYGSYVPKLPNGANVTGVKAIGHMNVEGGGARNTFGKDFKAMGASWTTELCMADSDGDGQTNGEELGDPCCVWDAATASTPLWTDGVSNPGDETSTTKADLLAAVDCFKTDNSSSSEESASTSGSAGNTTLISTTTSGSTTLTASVVADIITLLAALIA